jgi:homoserine kinase
MAIGNHTAFSQEMSDVRVLEGVEVVVPGSIGNVGPGFDALSLAVQLYLRARITRVEDDGRGALICSFVDCEISGPNRIERSFACVRARHAGALPSLHVEVRSEIPLRAGLGSSAAAVVAGLRLFELITEPKPLAEVLRIATDLEGHPDNAASALCGGLAACCEHDDGTLSAWSLKWPESIKLVVATPSVRLETSEARRVLPANISRADAVFNLQHTLYLLHALESGNRHAFREAVRDRWHQPYRRALVPGLDRLLALDDPDLLGVCLSGSGPSVVALADRNVPRVEALLRQTYADLRLPCIVRCLSVDQKGTR